MGETAVCIGSLVGAGVGDRVEAGRLSWRPLVGGCEGGKAAEEGEDVRASPESSKVFDVTPLGHQCARAWLR